MSADVGSDSLPLRNRSVSSLSTTLGQMLYYKLGALRSDI